MAKFSLPSFTLLAALTLFGLAAEPASAATKKKTPSKKPATKQVAKKSDSTSSSKATAKKEEPPPPAPPLAPGELPLVARSAISLDLQTGKVLYAKNTDAVEFPASSTKILTALLIIEAGNLDQVVTVQLEDTKVEPSALEIKVGETYTRRELLFALLLKSANDVALALARDNAGSVPAFAEKMNQRAAQLGANNSHFINPHGLHNAQHYTTAHDLALIARAAMQNPLFRTIVATPEMSMTKAGEVVKLRNHNRLLTMMAGCNGVKTGYTIPAQQVLVSSATRDAHEVLSVVLHTNKPGIWEDSKLLLMDGFVKLGVVIPPAELPPALTAPATTPPIPAPGATPASPAPAPAAPAAAAPMPQPAKPIAGEPRTSILPAN